MVTVVWSEDTRRHLPGAEIWVGVNTPGSEVPERVDALLSTLKGDGHQVVESDAHDDTALEAVHEPEFLRHLSRVHAEWMASEIPELVGQDRVVPYMFATDRMLDGLPGRIPPAVHARAGWYGYDTMTLVGPGTWEAARAAADCALTAVDLVTAGTRSAYALCRPPGHHAGRALFGGYCFLNNAALAAQHLRDKGFARVAVLDVDYHHGNGTQDIFWERSDVLFVSIHATPETEYPYFLGYADERGAGAGEGYTLNLPLPRGTGWQEYSTALGAALDAIGTFAPDALVVSLGVDTYEGDPISAFKLAQQHYPLIGQRLAGLKLPTVFVQEGGYAVDEIGTNVASVLEGFLRAR
jgi:acetoin utilization deacetylase AcuC-like enzyme